VFKVVYVARYRDTMSLDEGNAYWRDVHAPLGLKLHGLVGYTQNHMIGSIGPAGLVDAELPFHCYACEWWEDRAAFEAGMRSPEWAAVLEDGEKVFDPGYFAGMTAHLEERIMREGPRLPFKVVWFTRFRADVDRGEADEHWAKVHAPIALRVREMERYVQNSVRGALVDDRATEAPAAFDGFSECWFADEDAYLRAMADPAWADLVEDGHTFLDMDALTGMSGVIEERIIRLEPQPAAH
jgi:uncharacterized protein (TIGR02118 family)